MLNDHFKSIFIMLSRKCLLLTIILVSILIPAIQVTGEGDCGDCQNPLVEVMQCDLEGDMPESSDFGGWYEAKSGDADVATQFQRGFEILQRFMKNNPCADIYFMMDRLDERVRIGVDEGQAKYEIRSTATIHKTDNGEQTVVRHTIDERTPLDPPQTSPMGNLVYYTVKTIYDEMELVPTKAQVHVKHELVALKNDQVYDTGDDLIDWVDDPPEEEGTYFFEPDGEVESGGITYLPNDGLITGDVSPATVAALSIHLDKGDIGETIRKTETPSSCSLDVDDHSEFPPNYELKITDIKNQFNEILPDNVKIALRVEEGILDGGEMLDGWNVFMTKGGKITDQVLYMPPQCEDAKKDKLDIAGICDYHDGPESVGEKEFTKTITNSKCFDATLTITGTHVIHKEESHEGDWDQYEQYKRYDENIQASVTINLKKTNYADMDIFNEVWEYYKPQSAYISSFTATVNDHRYEMGFNSKSGIGFETDQAINGYGTGQKFSAPMFALTVIVVFDKDTGEAKRILSAGAGISYKLNVIDKLKSTQWYEGKISDSQNDSKSSRKSKTFELGPVEEPTPSPDGNAQIYPDFMVSYGDRVRFFGGQGNWDEDPSDNNCHAYDHCSEHKTFRWSFSRNVND